MKKVLACLALTSAFVAPSHAGAIYTTSASFLPNVASGAYTETFSTDFNNTPNSRNYSGGAFSYRASSSGGVYNNGVFLGAAESNTPLVINFTGAAVTAIGANFYNTNVFDNFLSVAITVALSDGTTQSFTPTSATNSYRGFTTDVAITSMTIRNTSANSYVGLDNLTVGRALAPAAVPEPASLAIVGLGLAGLGVMRRRRQS